MALDRGSGAKRLASVTVSICLRGKAASTQKLPHRQNSCEAVTVLPKSYSAGEV
jgi:hypothetical protein